MPSQPLRLYQGDRRTVKVTESKIKEEGVKTTQNVDFIQGGTGPFILSFRSPKLIQANLDAMFADHGITMATVAGPADSAAIPGRSGPGWRSRVQTDDTQ